MDKTLNLLGLCRRAGKLVPGNDAVLEEIRNRRASLVIVTNDISRNTEKKQKAVCEANATPLITLDRSKEELGHAIGKMCAVAAICDEGFARKLRELITNEYKEDNL